MTKESDGSVNVVKQKNGGKTPKPVTTGKSQRLYPKVDAPRRRRRTLFIFIIGIIVIVALVALALVAL